MVGVTSLDGFLVVSFYCFFSTYFNTVCTAIGAITLISANHEHIYIMVALCNRADHYILPFDFYLLLLSSFPRLISAAADWMSVILPRMVWT